jgi:hypothetical protein
MGDVQQLPRLSPSPQKAAQAAVKDIFQVRPAASARLP